MTGERMFDIGAQLMSRTIAERYTTRLVGPDHQGYRRIVDDAGRIFERGDVHPSPAYEANVVRIPKGWRAVWSSQNAEKNLIARVTYGPIEDHDILPLEARSFNTEAISDHKLHELVNSAAERYGLPIV